MSILQLFVCSQRKNGNKMATEKGKQENVEHVVIAAWPAECRAGTGNRRRQLTVGSTRCLGILGAGPDTDPASCTNYAHTHCCRTLRVEGLLHVINYPNRLRQIDLNRNQTTAAALPPPHPPASSCGSVRSPMTYANHHRVCFFEALRFNIAFTKRRAEMSRQTAQTFRHFL